MSQWISVEDRLPAEHQIIDVWSDEEDGRITSVEYYDSGFYTGEQQWDVDDCGFGCLSNTLLLEGITHWMPLPEPPLQSK